MTRRLPRTARSASCSATWTFQEREVSRAWVLCHLVEHFAHHSGQIALLASLRQRVEG